MSQEVAMDQYIKLLSERVPGWMEDKLAVSLSGFFNDARIENVWLKLFEYISFYREMVNLNP